MVYKRRRSEPQLRTIFPRREHYTEVVTARHQKRHFFLRREFRNASNQQVHLVIFIPVRQRISVQLHLLNQFCTGIIFAGKLPVLGRGNLSAAVFQRVSRARFNAKSAVRMEHTEVAMNMIRESLKTRTEKSIGAIRMHAFN